MGPTRLAFLGSPEPAAVALRALVGAGHEVSVVVTRPDKRRGRGGGASPTQVGAVADALGIPVAHEAAAAAASGAQLGVVVAYGRIIRPDVLAALPMVNVHFSLLPRWRGAAPVERAVLAGDSVTGVCLMEVEAGLDTGGVYRRAETPIDPDETAADLTGRLARLGADLLLGGLDEGLGAPEPQVGAATYADKVGPDDVRLDWELDADSLHRRVRVGRAWTTAAGRRLLVLSAHPEPGDHGAPGRVEGTVVGTGAGGLRLTEVQPEGRRPMAATDWARGSRVDALGD